MYLNWHFFRNFLSNVSVTLAKTDLDLAALYVQRLGASEHAHLLNAIRAEYHLTVEELRRLTQEDQLLGSNPAVARTLRMRDSYLAPLHYLQVELTDRWRIERAAGREPDAQTERALLFTVNGIAAGLRNTG